jgi:UDP-N-acetyl-D-mannosaminuronate dehydrogenase
MKAVFMGLGYIGLPTAAAAASKGVEVVGVDINPEVVNTVNDGKIHIVEPDLVMRDTTERPEAVEAGTVKLVGTDAAAIVANVERLLSDEGAYRAMARAHNPYGDGKAGEGILEGLGLRILAGACSSNRF